MKTRFRRCFALLATIISLSPFPGAAQTEPLIEPRNIILLIGDGMGAGQILAARYYLGENLVFENFSYQGQLTTANAAGSVTDSAAAGTAIATGHKVSNSVISIANPGDGSEYQTLLEYFKALGKSTGLVTTTQMTDATPAAFGAHEPLRTNKPQIAGDYLNQTRPLVLFGGGANGMTVAGAQAAGYTVATDRTTLLAFDPLSPSSFSGQFGSSDLPYEAAGMGAMPHLSDMALKALDILSLDADGYFLMIEGGRIDHACHSNNLSYMLGEMMEFNNTVGQVFNRISTRNDTLLIVLADHETGGLSVTANNGTGVAPAVTWSTTGHTGANIPLFAWGYGAEQVSGIMSNTEIFRIATEAGYVYNEAPQVEAGPDRTEAIEGPVTLAGVITDDGISRPRSTLTAFWEKISGPGTVAFADSSSASTTAAFSAVGTYVLQLTGRDGLDETSDQLTLEIAVSTRCGVGIPETDADGDGTPDCIDSCASDSSKTEPGICGCGIADTDSDSDGTANCHDGCPNDAGKTAAGICGCGMSDIDSDADATADCQDACPADPAKTTPGVCGCSIPDTDTDGDSTPDCSDACPADPGKFSPGICGCAAADTDADHDGVPDCHDQCAADSGKTAPGACGCSVPDTDSDADGAADCVDLCPADAGKTAPGTCGCALADSDANYDGIPDCFALDELRFEYYILKHLVDRISSPPRPGRRMTAAQQTLRQHLELFAGFLPYFSTMPEAAGQPEAAAFDTWAACHNMLASNRTYFQAYRAAARQQLRRLGRVLLQSGH